MPYKPKIHEAVMAYYRGELGGFTEEYLEKLMDVVAAKIEEVERVIRESPAASKNTEYMGDYYLYLRVKNKIASAIESHQFHL